MPTNLSGKIALIVGAGSGIGAAVAAVFAEEGAKTVLLGPEEDPLRSVAARTGGMAIVGDGARSGDVGAALAAATREHGGLDILVNCAGGGGNAAILDLSEEDWQIALKTNLETARISAKVCLPALIARRGAIVFVASLAGLRAAPGAAGYVTAKHALIGLMRSLACDYGPQGVRVNAVCPGFTRTAMADSVMDGLAARDGVDRTEAYRRATAYYPLRRPAEAIEIARIAAFLASDWASIITGEYIVADGGASAVNVV